MVDHKSIWIYVTNIETQSAISLAAKILNRESAIIKWTVDTEDIDNVLRIETISLKENYFPSLLAAYDLECVPMTD